MPPPQACQIVLENTLDGAVLRDVRVGFGEVEGGLDVGRAVGAVDGAVARILEDLVDGRLRRRQCDGCEDE